MLAVAWRGHTSTTCSCTYSKLKIHVFFRKCGLNFASSWLATIFWTLGPLSLPPDKRVGSRYMLSIHREIGHEKRETSIIDSVMDQNTIWNNFKTSPPHIRAYPLGLGHISDTLSLRCLSHGNTSLRFRKIKKIWKSSNFSVLKLEEA
jgi:hypothetical protein